MIVCTTGLPGAGKTLWALTWVIAKAKKEGRQVFYSGIKDLKLPWTEIDPEKWMDCPPNSIVVIDECQRVFRPRSHGQHVPKHVADLETHRHLGIDLVLITQHPMLIESNVRRLCGLHFHVVRKWGTAAATVHEWASIKDNCDKVRDDSVRHQFKYPKANYGLYHSAEVHTHKMRIPYHVVFIAAVPFALGYAGWRIYSNWFPKVGLGEAAVVAGPGLKVASGTMTNPQAAGQSGPLTATQYVEQFRPRVQGLDYTAPVYDKVAEAKAAPYPAACVANETRCGCYSQQATKLQVPEELCRQIAAGGFFIPWMPDALPVRNSNPAGNAYAGATVNAVSLTGSTAGAFAAQAQRAASAPPAVPASRAASMPEL